MPGWLAFTKIMAVPCYRVDSQVLRPADPENDFSTVRNSTSDAAAFDLVRPPQGRDKAPGKNRVRTRKH
ncbi:hypothetical protein ACKVWH_007148 [Pyricularia oryzae]